MLLPLVSVRCPGVPFPKCVVVVYLDWDACGSSISAFITTLVPGTLLALCNIQNLPLFPWDCHKTLTGPPSMAGAILPQGSPWGNTHTPVLSASMLFGSNRRPGFLVLVPNMMLLHLTTSHEGLFNVMNSWAHAQPFLLNNCLTLGACVVPHRLSVPSDPSVKGAWVQMDRTHKNNSVSHVFEDLYSRGVLFLWLC